MPSPSGATAAGQDRALLVLIVLVTLAFAWILWPMSGAVLWGVVFAILFAPVYRRLARSMRQRRNLAALATVAIIVVMVILPLGLIAAMLAQEASGVYERVQSGEINVGRYFREIFATLPGWVVGLLARFGVADLGDVQR